MYPMFMAVILRRCCVKGRDYAHLLYTQPASVVYPIILEHLQCTPQTSFPCDIDAPASQTTQTGLLCLTVRQLNLKAP